MSDYSESSLIKILSKISCSLKDVKIVNHLDYQEINREYKDAIFKIKDNNKAFKSNILSSCLKDEQLLHYYKDHACCWVNYIGCDSFSSKEKRQVFFASVLMEVEDQKKNKELLTVNESIFKIYNDSLDQNIPFDIWVQLYFYEDSRLKELLKPSEETNSLLKTLSIIQNQGMVIPVGKDDQNKNNNDLATLMYDKAIPAVTSANVDELIIKKDDVKSKDEEIVDILRSITRQEIQSSPLANRVFQLNKSLHQNVRYVYYLPAEGPDGTTGLIIYGASRELGSTEVRDLKLLGYNILFPYVSAYKSAWEGNVIIKESIKSAVAAIMSRNMSHNLGSHYLYYTKFQLQKIADGADSFGPDIRGAARVLGYIQARMDYLATVISNDKYTPGSVNFKSQIYDELTVDDFSKRHFSSKQDENKRITNFLLSNIIMSENYTRPDVINNQKAEGLQTISLYLRLKSETDDNTFDLFTGTNKGSGENDTIFGEDTIYSEAAVKERISNIYISLPGGAMSCHAFFNVVENFIRNSAKYLHIEKDLVFTIAIWLDSKNYYHFVLYDNKENANTIVDDKSNKTLFDSILEKLAKLKIIDEKTKEVEKQSKGFKEMLFSSIWMQLNNIEAGQTYSSILMELNETNPEKRLELIERYAFKMRQVVDDHGTLQIKGRNEIADWTDEDRKRANLGIELVIPQYNNCEEVYFSDDINECINTVMHVHSDIVEVDEENYNSNIFGHCFTRVYKKDKQSSEKKQVSYIDKFKKILSDRFGNIDDYKLVFDSKNEALTQDENEAVSVYRSKKKCSKEFGTRGKLLLFLHHMNTTFSLDDFKGYGYADTVSGGNFTYTLKELFEKGISEDGKYLKDSDRYFALKIKESALTRITIIDERLFNSMSDPLEFQMKNIRLLNYSDDSNCQQGKLLSIFDGNSFYDNDPYSLFLSIHLGLVEKILKNSEFVNDLINSRLGVRSVSESEKLSSSRVTVFMQLLKESIGHDKEVFMAIHSGRGNFSKELEGPLANYPFITLSSLENALHNSKYLLSQLFYNTIFVGKGTLNNHVK